MKTTDYFKQCIQEYLEQKAREDELFRAKYENPNKNLDDCITYLLNYVKASGVCGMADAEVFGICVHYFEEPNIEVGKPIDCNVVVNRAIELTDEEKAEARQQAIIQYRNDELRKLQVRANKQAAKREATMAQQPSLFDF